MQWPDRAQTGLLVERDERRLLLDCGAGVLGRLANTDGGYERTPTVLLTHHHLDHVADVLPLLKARWLAGEDHLTIVGPPGTKALVDDLLSVHDYLRDRVDLRLREVHPGEFSVAGFDVRARETRHSMAGLAYRFGDDFAFSGDTEAFAGMGEFVDGVRVAAHDCSFTDDVDVSNHPTPTGLGESLAGVDVGRLYLTHLYPHTEGSHEEMLGAVERAAGGGIDARIARDGLHVEC
ncbi:MAG: MBL fold metallo-hydrolase [Haloferacaceae archaeon]